MGVPRTSLHAGTRCSVCSGRNRTEYTTLVYIGSYNLSLFLYLLFGLIINSRYFVYLGSRVEISYPPKIYNSYVHIDAFFFFLNKSYVYNDVFFFFFLNKIYDEIYYTRLRKIVFTQYIYLENSTIYIYIYIFSPLFCD